MTTKYTQQDVADALTVFITSGSASGDEAMRKYCLSRVKLFADADRLRAVNAELVAALESLVLDADDLAEESNRNCADSSIKKARAALAKYKEGK